MKTKFNIGDWIKASAIVEFDYVTENPDDLQRCMRISKRIDRDVCGQVVGGGYRQRGRYRSGGACRSIDGDDYDQPTLKVMGVVFVLLVREGFLNKPVEVLPEDAMACERGKMPRLKAKHPPITKKFRELMREVANEMPRKNGRFAKSGATP